MTSGDLAYAAVEHRETPRVPYSLLTTGEANAQIRDELGVEDAEAWLDNDSQSVGVPWWVGTVSIQIGEERLLRRVRPWAPAPTPMPN